MYWFDLVSCLRWVVLNVDPIIGLADPLRRNNLLLNAMRAVRTSTPNLSRSLFTTAP